MTTNTKEGGRKVELFLPFMVGDKNIVAIEFSPVTWGHTLDWQAGKYQRTFDLMLDLAGVDDTVLRGLKYPDVDRVVTAFMELLPTEIRDDMANGHIPQVYVPEHVGATSVEQTELESELEPELPLSTPGLEHPEGTDPTKFNIDDWTHIKENALAKNKNLSPPVPKDTDGVGFALNE
jgi:hypothetical protein